MQQFVHLDCCKPMEPHKFRFMVSGPTLSCATCTPLTTHNRLHTSSWMGPTQCPIDDQPKKDGRSAL